MSPRKPTTLGERMASMEMWQSEHEKVCGDRYQLLMRVIAAGVTVLIAVASFGLANLWNGQQDQMRLLQQAVQHQTT